MKSFRPINIVPMQVNTFGETADTPEIVALKQQFNDKLREVTEKTNEAIASLTGGTLDMGLWASGEIIEVHGRDASDDEQDVAVRHHMGQVPTYWLVLDQISHSPGIADQTAQQIVRGVTTWTDSLVYFRIPTACMASVLNTTFKILLIP